MYLGLWEIDDFLTFVCNTHDPADGAGIDADGVATYRVYEDETGTPILTGSMALFDAANTVGFYSEQIQLTAGNGFEVGKHYTIYITATVDSIAGTMSHNFQVDNKLAGIETKIDTIDTNVDAILVDTGTTLPASLATIDSNVDAILVDTGTTIPATLSTIDGKIDTIDGIVDSILVDTGTNLPAEHAALATQASVDTIDANVDAILVDTGTTLPATLSTIEGKIDTVDTVVDAIKAVTDLLPDAGALNDLAAILTDTGTTLPAEHATLATAASIAALNDLSSADVAAELATYDGPTRAEATSDKDEIIAEVDANEAKIDIIDTNVDAILVDTGTTLPGEHSALSGQHGSLATAASIAALNDLSSADVQTVLETNDLDHLAKVAHPTGDPVADTLLDLIMNKDGSQTFARATDSLEGLADGAGSPPSAADIADAVWDEDAADHTTADTFGDKNQNKVPSETIADYKADVSALATQASVDTIDANVDAILVDTGTTLPATLSTIEGKIDTIDTVVDAIQAVTDNLPDSGQLLDLALILTDTGTTLPAEHALLATAASIIALNDLSSADVAAELATYDGPTRAEATSDKNEILADTGSIEGKVDTIDANVDSILVDTGTTIPAQIGALENLSAANVQTVLETNDLDHLAKVAHPTGDPVADTLIDLIMNKDGSQTFSRATDSLEGQVDTGGSGPTAAQIADAVWDEDAADHTTADTFGDKNQNQVPSETLNDYKADVSALASQASVDTIDANVDAILVDTGTTIPGTLATMDSKLDTIDTVVDAIKLITDALPDSGQLLDLAAILLDTGTTLPAEHALLATAASIVALNDLSSADIQAVLETNDLDHIAKVAHPSGDPVADTLFDLVMNKDGSQTFARATDSLEGLADGAGSPPSAAAIADAVWDEDIADHTTSTKFGGKNQKVVPSETINDYKADVSGLATSAALATHDGKLDTVDTVVDAIKLVTDALPDSGQLLDLAAILVDTGTTLPAQISALNNLSSANVQTVLETNDLDHLAKVAHPSGDPVADTLFDLIMNKDGSQTFDRSADSLEAISDSGGGGPTVQQIVDGVWDELVSAHTGGTSFGGKNQIGVPSATLNDYKADVSGLATSAALATVDTVVDAIKAVTDLLPDGGALTTIDSNIDTILVDTNELQTDWTDGGRLDLILDAVKVDTAAILIDTGTTLPASLATIDTNVDAILVDTGTTIPGLIGDLDTDLAAVQADIDQLLLDTADILDDTADILIDTAAILAAIGGGPPAGAITFDYNLTNSQNSQPIADADVWVTTDAAGINVIASGKTDQFGDVTFYLDAGNVYVWSQKTGFNFDNPDEEVIS
jgi:hypothetical protein